MPIINYIDNCDYLETDLSGAIKKTFCKFHIGDSFFDYLSLESASVLKECYNTKQNRYLEVSFIKACRVYHAISVNFLADKVAIYLFSNSITSFIKNYKDIIDSTNRFKDYYFFFDINKLKITNNINSNLNFDCIENIEINEEVNYFLHPEQREELEVFLQNLKKPKGKKSDSFKFHTDVSNAYKWYSLDFITYNDDLYLGHFHNINDTIKEREKIIKKSMTDSLSGVFIKEAAISQISDFLLTKPDGNHIMLMLDLDYFKNINDSYGHLFGDYVIASTAQALKKVATRNGIVGRMGGDEFILFIPNVNTREDIKFVARNIRYALDNLNVNNKVFRSSATMGISQYPKDGLDYDTLFKKADKALYRGKLKGRDCHIIYDEALHGSIDKQIDKYDDHMPITQSRISFITDILNAFLSGEDENKCLKYALKEAVNFFILDHVAVYKIDGGKVIEYESYYNEESYGNRAPLEIDYDVDSTLDMFTSDNLSFTNDARQYDVSNPYLAKVYNKMKIVSGIQVLLLKDDKRVGLITFAMQNGCRVWQRDEIMNCSIVARIVNVFFNKIKK